MRAPWVVPAVVALLVLAGCVSPVADPAALDPASLAASAAPAFTFEASECAMGGFVAPYPTDRYAEQGVPDDWTLADIREEVANPVHDGIGMPVLGPLSGNWHLGTRCAGATHGGESVEDFEWGWVGVMVEAPAWDTGGADVHFLLTGLALENGTFGEALRNATTADITHAFEVSFDWTVAKENPRSFVYTRFGDVERGLYESWSTMHAYRDVPDRVYRFWWQVPADGSEATSGHDHTSGGHDGDFNPVHFDLRTGPGLQYTTPPADGVELGSHNMFHMEHGPGVLAQPTVTNVYEQGTQVFELGRVFPDIHIHEIWTH